jgi:hypothetical protein
MNYKKLLLDKIQNLISGNWDVPGFHKEYYLYYFKNLPTKELSVSEETFFSLIAEGWDWTDEHPNSEDQEKYGWMNYPQYIEYVKRLTEAFKKDEDKWYEEYSSGNNEFSNLRKAVIVDSRRR